MPEPLAELVDVLARRGTLDVLAALEGGALPERGLLARVRGVSTSVALQRVAELRRLDAVETVPETGELRLSPAGRRLQDLLRRLGDWAVRGR